MSVIDPETVEAVRDRYSHCFGCGLDNPIGLRVDGFEREGDEVRAKFTPRPEYVGFHGILHGGVVATALDEILAWTAILVAGSMAVTVKVEFKFRNPAPSDVEYQLTGRLVEQRGRRLVVEGFCAAGGEIIAEAKGLFLATEAISTFS